MNDEVVTDQTEEIPLSHEEQMDQHNIKMLQNQIDGGKFTLPEQFKSAEEFMKAYKAIQGQATKASQENVRLKENIEAVEALENKEEVVPVTDMAQELLKPANEDVQSEGGLDWDAIDAELKSKGDLSEETRKAMLLHVPQRVIDSTVSAHKAAVSAGAKEAADLVGGQENLKALLAWGNQTLNEGDQKVLADQLSGPGWKLALMGLKTLYAESNPTPADKEPKTIIDGGPGPIGQGKVEPFATSQEMSTAIRDPRYGKEKEFTEMVMARTIASQGTLVNASLVDKRIRRF